MVSVKQAVLELAHAEYAGRDLKEFYAQAYDARNFAIRDRCWKCRETFRFNWVCQESNPNTVDSESVRDFGGLWVEGPVIWGITACGMYAEYLLWLEE